MPKILDVIIHSCHGAYAGYKQTFVVIDKPLNFLYERRGIYLVANDDGFYNTFYYERPGFDSRWRAFAGREFEIPMKDGTVIKANGQWWDGGHEKNAPEEIEHVGVATINELNDCYVFTAGHISKAKLDSWLKDNTPGAVYDWYDIRRLEREFRRVL